MDAYVKILLTVIAACLLLQVAQGFGLAGASGPMSPLGEHADNRYMIQPVPMARVVLRFDHETGRTWTMPLHPQAEKFWTLVDEAPPEQVVPEETIETPTRPRQAGGGKE